MIERQDRIQKRVKKLWKRIWRNEREREEALSADAVWEDEAALQWPTTLAWTNMRTALDIFDIWMLGRALYEASNQISIGRSFGGEYWSTAGRR